MEKKIIKRVKSTFKNDEERALKSVLEKNPDLTVNDLNAMHSEKEFIWEAPDDTVLQSDEETKFGTQFKVPCKDVETEGEAEAMAIEHFGVEGGNLKTDHSKSHYIFEMIREHKA